MNSIRAMQCIFGILVLVCATLLLITDNIHIKKMFILVRNVDFHFHVPNMLTTMSDINALDANKMTVAIILALTSAGQSETRFYKGPLFTAFIPSFCNTASKNISYTLYVSHDFSDTMFNSLEKLNKFHRKVDETANKCVQLELEFVKCSHQNHPAWAQNDGALAAYRHGLDFFYRVNDDTIFVSKNWTLIFIEQLRKMKPPLLGVVGPNHEGGNTAILTYDFVHRTHIDLFGFHYPREFTDWYADSWITEVYLPNNSHKLSNIELLHTLQLGTRYKPDYTKVNFYKNLVTHGQTLVKAWRLFYEEAHSQKEKDNRKVIAFLANSTDDDVFYGLLRNINLARLWFPTWKVHISVTDVVYSNKSKSLKLMQKNGADIEKIVSLKRNWVQKLIENPHIEYLLVRHPLTRLSRTESSLTLQWVQDQHEVKDTKFSSVCEKGNATLCSVNIKTKNIREFSTKHASYLAGDFQSKLMQEFPREASAYDICKFATAKNSTLQEQQFLGQRFDKHELRIDKLINASIIQVCQDDYSSYSDIEFYRTAALEYRKR